MSLRRTIAWAPLDAGVLLCHLMPMLLPLIRYFARLTPGRMVLWCYAIWYGVSVARHFDPRPRLWLTSLGLGFIIGVALILSTRPAVGESVTPPDHWQTFRLFLMPFCVSSFAALVKDAGFVLIFPPTLHGNLIGLAAIAAFLLMVAFLRRLKW